VAHLLNHESQVEAEQNLAEIHVVNSKSHALRKQSPKIILPSARKWTGGKLEHFLTEAEVTYYQTAYARSYQEAVQDPWHAAPHPPEAHYAGGPTNCVHETSDQAH
jgi:hypothetical protein